jgi:hypothetical protein
MANWHHIFGLTLADSFIGTPYTVELEKELSLKQRLDVVIIRKEGKHHEQEFLDGLDNLSNHNLLTYKSLHQPLDSWSLDELIGQYVTYRKMVSKNSEEPVPFDNFRLYGVSTREPQKLSTEVELTRLRGKGVYEVCWGVHSIRIIVTGKVAQIPRNALWHLFSAIPENVLFEAQNYHWRLRDNRNIIHELLESYNKEGLIMSYTFEDFYREFTKNTSIS